MFPFPGIGIVFDIEQCGGNYGHGAWRLFMKYAKPSLLGSCILVEGDTAATLSGRANEFCIGIFGLGVDAEKLRQLFEAADDTGFAQVHRRFIEKPALDGQPLAHRGQLDAFGRLVTDRWTRTDHELCKEAGWGYTPKQVPADLTPEQRAELERLKTTPLDEPTLPRAPPKPAAAPSKPPADDENFLRFRCPTCNKRLRVSPVNCGKKVKCPKCGNKVLAPAAEEIEVDWSTVKDTSPREKTAAAPRSSRPSPKAGWDPARAALAALDAALAGKMVDLPPARRAPWTEAQCMQYIKENPATLHELLSLVGRDGGFRNRDAIRRIGEKLNAAGGFELMQAAYYYVRRQGPYFSQDIWHGIGAWQQ